MLLAEEEFKNEKKKEMREDALKNLEYRTYDSKREMEILEATDKVKELNKREENIDYDFLMEKIKEKKYKNNLEINNDKNEDEDKEIKKIFEDFNKNKNKDKKNIFNNSDNGKGEMFLLKKKFLRDEFEDENKNNKNNCLKIKNKTNKMEHFLSSSDDEDKNDNEKKIKDIFKKPILNFSKNRNDKK